MQVKITTGLGDAVDRLQILKLKCVRLNEGAAKRAAVQYRQLYDEVTGGWQYDDTLARLINRLFEINEALWDMEDEIREALAANDVWQLANAAKEIVDLNDERSRLKAEIDVECGDPEMADSKQYKGYKI